MAVTTSDGIASDGETFRVAVTNAAPVLGAIGHRTMSHTQDVLSIGLSATDADGDDLTYSARLIQGEGNVSLLGDVLTIDPADRFAGELQVRVVASDGIATADETFTVTVTNSTPVLAHIADQSMSHTQDTMVVDLAAEDADGDTLFFVAAILGDGGDHATATLVGTRLTIDPVDGFAGELEVGVAVGDGISSDAQVFTVTVTNSAPVLDPIGDRTISHTQDVITIVLSASDADGDPLTYSATLNQEYVADGTISHEGDVDWFQFDAIAGKSYTIHSELNNLPGSLLVLYDQDGVTSIARDDGRGTGQNSSIAFTPQADGTYYLAVASHDGLGLGQYEAHFAVENTAPMLEEIGDQTLANSTDVLDLTLAATDADGDALTYSAKVLTPDGDKANVTVEGNRLLIDPIDGFVGQFRVLVSASDRVTTVGETFLVSVTGTAPESANLGGMSFDGRQMILQGTGGDDTFTFDAAAHRVTVNGISYMFDPTQVESISFDGGLGHDSAEIIGTAGDDTLRVEPNRAVLSGTDYQLEVVNVAQLTVIGGGGQDSAEMYDSPGDDLFVGKANYAGLSGDRFAIHVQDFGTVSAFATAGGHDTVKFYDSVGNDQFVATANYGGLSGAGYALHTVGFEAVHAFASAGGNDTTKFYDSAGDDTFYATPDDAALYGEGFYNRAKGFESVHAYATSGGHDVAQLFDSPDNEIFYGTVVEGGMIGNGFFNRAKHFEEVRGYADQGGFDVAKLYDSPGDDSFVATPTNATLSGEGFRHQVRNFDGVHAYGTSGGYDVAKLYDSAGDDLFYGDAREGALFKSGEYYNRAKYFEAVHAYATAGGNDRAELFDSAGDDTFVATDTEGALFGSDFYNRAKHFEEVNAHATGGGYDVAEMFDSAGDDTFVATPNEAVFSGETFFARAKYFDQVNAHATRGGYDVAKLFDSAGDDTFTGTASESVLSGSRFSNRVESFEGVYAYAINGGEDSAQLFDSVGNDYFEAVDRCARMDYGDSFVSALDFSWVNAVAALGGHDTRDIHSIDFILETPGALWLGS